MGKLYQRDLQEQTSKRADAIIQELPEFARTYFTHLIENNVSPATRLQYAYDMRMFFDYLNEMKIIVPQEYKTENAAAILDKLTLEDIQEYVDTLEYQIIKEPNGRLRQKPYSESAKARKISSLRSFFKYYFRIREIEKDLTALIDVPKIPEKKNEFISEAQIQKILASVKDTSGMNDHEVLLHSKYWRRDLAIMMLILRTWLQASELIRIDVTDINLNDSSLLITRKNGKKAS